MYGDCFMYTLFLYYLELLEEKCCVYFEFNVNVGVHCFPMMYVCTLIISTGNLKWLTQSKVHSGIFDATQRTVQLVPTNTIVKTVLL
jgi:hypothetical protein